MLTAQVESFTELQPQLAKLFPLHWEELALNQDKVPLDPQYEVYFERERRGEVLLITLRERGEIAGYFIGFVAPGLHYKTCLTCIMDIFYVSPEHRNKRGGIKLFREVEKECKRRGVQRMMVGSKDHKPAARLFEALGYIRIESYYSVWLGD